MLINALFLVLLGSLLHLGWNIYMKKARNKFLFVYWCSSPLALCGLIHYYFIAENPPDPQTSGLILASGLVHALYFFALSKAYTQGDLSFIYPFCRSLGAAFVVLLAFFFLKETPTKIGFLGILLCIVGPLLEPLRKFSIKTRKSFLWALQTSLLIGLYLFIDKIGATQMNAFLYICYFLLSSFFFMTLFVFLGPLKEELFKEDLRHVIISSLFFCAAYTAVISAMKIAPISYVACARSSGILMSAFAGHFFFKEKITRLRLYSIGLIVIGVFLLSL